MLFLICSSCQAAFEDSIAEGNYYEAEHIIKNTRNEKKYQYAEILI